jgi:hypothetical protein
MGSKMQCFVALLCREAEYVGLRETSKEAVHVRRLVSGFIGAKRKNIVIYNDNQSAIKLASNPLYYNRTKHIALK